MFGQLVIGPPGSGKTTYCNAMKELLTKLGRKVAVVNLDPANDFLPYECAISMNDLIGLEEVMDELGLGPNGGLVYCMEYLAENIDWLDSAIDKLPKDTYLLIDCPGQIELYTHQSAMRDIVQHLTSSAHDHRLCAVHLVDSHHCSDPGKFISVLMTALTGMLALALPHVNVLSKADLIDKNGKLPFNTEFFTEVLDLSYLLNQLNEDNYFKKYRKFNEALVGLVEDHSLVTFVLLTIQDKDAMLNVLKQVDKATGYIFGNKEDRNLHALLSTAMGIDFNSSVTAKVQENYVNCSNTCIEMGENIIADDEEEIDFML